MTNLGEAFSPYLPLITPILVTVLGTVFEFEQSRAFFERIPSKICLSVISTYLFVISKILSDVNAGLDLQRNLGNAISLMLVILLAQIIVSNVCYRIQRIISRGRLILAWSVATMSVVFSIGLLTAVFSTQYLGLIHGTI